MVIALEEARQIGANPETGKLLAIVAKMRAHAGSICVKVVFR